MSIAELFSKRFENSTLKISSTKQGVQRIRKDFPQLAFFHKGQGALPEPACPPEEILPLQV